ncbi:MAG: FdtA/QdtA family cupin domain-containing protein [Pseudomonadota bacterium]|nr:FdtA/QdtA family cupin domain-containing protein [Pseudomonadota bacterium]
MLLDIQEIQDQNRGTLYVAEYQKHIPFETQRVFFISDVAAGKIRGGHAHLSLKQFIVCIKGSVKVEAIFRGGNSNYTLDRLNHGLYLPPMTWVDLEFCGDENIIAVLASEKFDEKDYIRDKGVFIRLLKQTEGSHKEI